MSTQSLSRRKRTAHFKLQIVMEALRGEKTHAEISRQYSIHPQLITGWKRDFLQNGHKVFERTANDDAKNRKIQELETIIGKQTIEIQFLKKVLGHLG